MINRFQEGRTNARQITSLLILEMSKARARQATKDRRGGTQRRLLERKIEWSSTAIHCNYSQCLLGHRTTGHRETRAIERRGPLAMRDGRWAVRDMPVAAATGMVGAQAMQPN